MVAIAIPVLLLIFVNQVSSFFLCTDKVSTISGLHYYDQHKMMTRRFLSFLPPESDREEEEEADSIPSRNEQTTPSSFLIDNSLELMAVAVSIFFIATVAIEGDNLFATPSTIQSGSSSRTIIDPDAVLRQDFERVPTSVEF